MPVFIRGVCLCVALPDHRQSVLSFPWSIGTYKSPTSNALIAFRIFMPPCLPSPGPRQISRPLTSSLPQEAQLSLYFVVAPAPPEQGPSSSLARIGLFASTIQTTAPLSLGLGSAAQDTHYST